MRFLAAVAALAMVGTVSAAPLLPPIGTPVSWSTTGAIFQDPFSHTAAADLLLGITVNTPCPNSLSVQVTVPKQTHGCLSGTTDLDPAQFIPGMYNGFTAGAKVKVKYTGDCTSVWTFSDFQDIHSEAVVGVPSTANYYRINVDFLESVIKAINPGFSVTDPNPDPNYTFPPAIQLTGTANTDAFYVYVSSETCKGGSGVSGDPVFAGFQGQNFQFHGLPDEHFNLVSSPNVQVNSHFVYLSSGKCDYNDTECYTHPGTYMDVLGFSIADAHVKLVAGTHDQGLRIWMNDAELHRGAHVRNLANSTASLKYHHNGRVEIQTDVMNFEVVNSDMFMNIKAALNDQELLRVGSTKHTVTDKAICKANLETHDHQLVERTVSKKYPVTSQLHGLIGQTWRNVKVCGRDWMGTVQDYLVSDLFASDNHYNYFKW